MECVVKVLQQYETPVNGVCSKAIGVSRENYASLTFELTDWLID